MTTSQPKEIRVSDGGGWKPGDVGLSKEVSPGRFMMVRDRNGILGLKAGVDGWTEFRVVDEGPAR